jgi:hypothetical protein
MGRCEECHYMRLSEDADDSVECRRHAPSPLLVRHNSTHAWERRWVIFPIMHFDDWCGEFKPREDT